jgi:hypothetical protein
MIEPTVTKNRIGPKALDAVLSGAIFYVSSSLVVLAGAITGKAFLPAASGLVLSRDLTARFANFNGECYVAIAERGFSYRADEETSVTFFPAYPLLGRWLAQATRMRTDAALVMLSHVCLLGALAVMAAYVRSRRGHEAIKLADYTLVAMG